MLKKLICFLICVLFIFSFINCGNTKDTNDDKEDTTKKERTLLEMVPASSQLLAYINVDKLMSIEAIAESATKAADEKIMGYLEKNKFSEFVMGAKDLDPTLKGIENSMFILASGTYDKANLIEMAQDKELDKDALSESTKVQGLEAIKNDKVTLVFISDKLVLLVSNEIIDEVMNSIIKNNGSIDVKSTLYQNAEKAKSKNNLLWAVSNLEFMGKQKLSDLDAMTGGMLGLDAETNVHDVMFGFNITTEIFSLLLSAKLDEDITENVAEKINNVIPTLGLFANQIPDEELKADAMELIQSLKFSGANNELSTEIKIKLTTLEKISTLYLK